jgi:hypothetical protein
MLLLDVGSSMAGSTTGVHMFPGYGDIKAQHIRLVTQYQPTHLQLTYSSPLFAIMGKFLFSPWNYESTLPFLIICQLLHIIVHTIY